MMCLLSVPGTRSRNPEEFGGGESPGTVDPALERLQATPGERLHVHVGGEVAAWGTVRWLHCSKAKKRFCILVWYF